ncbi:MAG: phosphate acyltransferase [Akkermansiaceae bacterium]|jgi:phosphotransacetylase|nr:phosphate acyltransferase [Akkermansiaceae bacterium]MCU0779381.1 phosphate acyltransferase [Akkermansiaceae bacterium]
MTDFPPEPQSGTQVVRHLLDQLRRHPKRVVFTEGEDIRVIEAAARLVREEVVAPILLGNRERIRAMAAEQGIPMKFIHVIDPVKASDFTLFCQRVVNMARYRSMRLGNPAEIVARPHYFGALMVQYGQADAIVGGNQAIPAAYFRALIQTIKPMPHVPRMFGVSILTGPHLKNLGGSGILLLADSALIPNPTVEELAAIAIDTGKLAHHFLGRKPHVALLSYSTKGSAGTPDARRMSAAASLAQAEVLRDFLDIEIEGELQADVALDPEAAEIKFPSPEARPTADVLVFPNLDAAHIAMKLLQHVAGAQVYGQFIRGLSRPAAQVPRTASVETIFGTAAAIAVEAIKFHQLYPEGEV